MAKRGENSGLIDDYTNHEKISTFGTRCCRYWFYHVGNICDYQHVEPRNWVSDNQFHSKVSASFQIRERTTPKN